MNEIVYCKICGLPKHRCQCNIEDKDVKVIIRCEKGKTPFMRKKFSKKMQQKILKHGLYFSYDKNGKRIESKS